MSRISATGAIAKPVIVLGAGGHAKVLIAALGRLNARILGATDADAAKRSENVLGVPVLGGDEALSHHDPAAVLLVNGLGTAGQTGARRAICERFAGLGFRFAAVVDPWALLSDPVEIGEGAQVLAGAVVQPGARLGANCIVNTRASVDHDCVIGAHAHIAPGATLSGGVRVGEGAHVGTGASVIHAVRVGAGSVVGAGAAVIADVPDGATVAGVPARIVK
ncbi:MAG: acetyltransferase [Rhodospirillales bacterium]|nr:acetyltransferase [Rhodospirillales bacterium]